MSQAGEVHPEIERQVRFPDQEDLEAARHAVRRFLSPTPVIPLPMLGNDVWAKVETVLPTGSFKVRGGIAAASAHEDDSAARRASGLVTASAGNHGLGVGFAGTQLGIPVTVAVSSEASPAKTTALKAMGVELIETGHSYEEAERAALALAAERGLPFVSPYNDPHVIAGQATLAAEILEQVPDVTTVVVPAGGGGLLAGTSLALRNNPVRVVGVAAEHSKALVAAVEAGRVVPVDVSPTIAEGLAGNLEPGSITVDLVRRLRPSLVTATEDAIRHAMRRLATEAGLVVEGSGAAAVAAVSAGDVEVAGGTAVVVLTGRNVTAAVLASVLNDTDADT